MACDFISYEKGNGEISSEKRMINTFTEIQLTGNYEIGLKKGPEGQLVLVTDGNLLEFIHSEVVNGVLIIENSKKIRSNDGIKIYITYQELAGIKSVGASIIKTENTIVANRFKMDIPGAGIIDLEVDVNDLEVTLTGAGLVKLKGRAVNQMVSLNGVGSLEAFDLESRSCKVTVSGMGKAEINVKENLNARVIGIGSIKYRGSPTTVDDKISGLGTIRPVEEDDGSDYRETS
jgi:hypothetical protein